VSGAPIPSADAAGSSPLRRSHRSLKARPVWAHSSSGSGARFAVGAGLACTPTSSRAWWTRPALSGPGIVYVVQPARSDGRLWQGRGCPPLPHGTSADATRDRAGREAVRSMASQAPRDGTRRRNSKRCGAWSSSALIPTPPTGADPRPCNSRAGRRAAEGAGRRTRVQNNRRSSNSSKPLAVAMSSGDLRQAVAGIDWMSFAGLRGARPHGGDRVVRAATRSSATHQRAACSA